MCHAASVQRLVRLRGRLARETHDNRIIRKLNRQNSCNADYSKIRPTVSPDNLHVLAVVAGLASARLGFRWVGGTLPASGRPEAKPSFLYKKSLDETSLVRVFACGVSFRPASHTPFGEFCELLLRTLPAFPEN